MSLLSMLKPCATGYWHDKNPSIVHQQRRALFNDYAETSEGIERSAALRFSPWRMTERLLLAEHHQPPARVINVISGGMYTQKLRCAHLVMKEENYNGRIRLRQTGAHRAN